MENDNIGKNLLRNKEYNFINEKKRIKGIIFTRACCCIGIIIFHYFSYSKGNFKFLYNTANSSFGFLFVTSFFCLSGAVLYYNHGKIKSIKIFYYKRWKSIFPSYYLCYIYFYFKYAMRFRKLFFKGHWSKLFLTLIGLDGYLFYFKFKTYYLIGEWFLGAIIILYIIYPLLSWLMHKNIIIFNSIIIILYFLMLSYQNKSLLSK